MDPVRKTDKIVNSIFSHSIHPGRFLFFGSYPIVAREKKHITNEIGKRNLGSQEACDYYVPGISLSSSGDFCERLLV